MAIYLKYLKWLYLQKIWWLLPMAKSQQQGVVFFASDPRDESAVHRTSESRSAVDRTATHRSTCRTGDLTCCKSMDIYGNLWKTIVH